MATETKKKTTKKKPAVKKKAGVKKDVKKKAAPEKKVKPKGGKSVTRTIKVDELSRVEGEGALFVRVVDNEIKECKFKIVEPPRFFEAFLRGRDFKEVPDITARICGICPMAYLMGSQQAMEQALKVEIPQDIRDMRRIMYCGEWIESHVLHAAMLHAPDFLGFDDILKLAETNKQVVQNALRLKKLGNTILEVIGGRAIHPINTRVGGFYKIPDKEALNGLKEELKWGIETSIEIAKLFGTFDFPDFEYDYHYVSLQHADEYAILEGDVVSNHGIHIPVSEFHKVFQETHVEHSTALRGSTREDDEPYLTGPNARYNNNYDQLSVMAKQVATSVGIGKTCNNPFKSILVRMIETAYCCEEALRLINKYDGLSAPFVEAVPRASEGFGMTEAPRGVCYHAYKIDEEGRILHATISSPTSQNQPQIERDLHGVLERSLDLDEVALTRRCEQTIRNYDPCISCSAHFLNLTMVRE